MPDKTISGESEVVEGIQGEVRTEKEGQISAKEEAKQVADVDKVIKQRPREFSFLDKNPENYEVVETSCGEMLIPAQVGSTYWAIIKVMYLNINKIIFKDDLCAQVAEHMNDRDPDDWEKYTSKPTVKAFHKAEKKHSVKPANSWQDRIVGNAKTLTRIKGNYPYGKRLLEQGCQLTYDYQDGKLYFILSSDLKPVKE